MVRGIENARMLVRAGWGAMSGVTKNYAPYLDRMRREPIITYNPPLEQLRQNFQERTMQTLSHVPRTMNELLSLEWEDTNRGIQRIELPRLAASLVAFTNDQGRNVAREFFPVAKIHEFISQVQDKYSLTGKPLTVLDQFDVALTMTHENPLSAALLAHSVYRAVARNWDTKIDKSLAFTNNEMVSMAKATADFYQKDALQHDPLGDTYHWWSEFSAEMIFTLLRRRRPIQSSTYSLLFHQGANLTRVARGKLFQRTMSSGYHAEVDRQGWLVGREVGKVLRTQVGHSAKSYPVHRVEPVFN